MQPNDPTLRELQARIGEWADTAFGQSRTPAAALLKLFEECGEYIKDPTNGEELADIVIMAIDLANLAGIDLQNEVVRKHTKNQSRRWAMDPLGTMSHVK